MLQRIREVMKNNDNTPFTGITEIDEAYIGDSETNKHSNKKGKYDKVCVFGMVNRNTKRVKVKSIQILLKVLGINGQIFYVNYNSMFFGKIAN